MDEASSSSGVFPVLDLVQLKRIESTHRGFLYQHVYGAGCLLIAGRSGVQYVAIERDEDIELRLASRHVYVQVKTRHLSLEWSDIADTVCKFDEIRRSHADARLPRVCELWIVCNVPPSPPLLKRLADVLWPSDVRLLWPGGPTDPPCYLPPAWRNITAGVAWCSNVARSLPFGALLPETLTWKLAATVQFAATGSVPYVDHRINVEDLPLLFELITTQLQEFPEAPLPYREIEDEPALVSKDRLRIIIGVSGAGKTSWATEAAYHTQSPVGYFNVAQLPSDAVPAGIARELARAFVAESDAARFVFAPGLAGLDALRLLDRVLDQYSREVTIVIDNAHGIDASTYRQMVDATKRIHWVLLAQPCFTIQQLSAALNLSVTPLGPWTRDSVVAEFAAQGCPITPETAERVRRLTGWLPLFTRQAAALSVCEYVGDIDRLCHDLENRTHTVQTAQESILQAVAKTLDDTTQRTGGVLSLSDVPLSADESLQLVTEVLLISPVVAASAIRTLRQVGIVVSDTATVYVHDSFRLVLREFVEESQVTAARLKLTELVRTTLTTSWEFRRFGFLLRLLVATGDDAAVVDISTSLEERLLEYGMVPEVRAVLESLVQSVTASGNSRFWAKDTLVYWSIQHGCDADHLAEEVRQLAEINATLLPDKKRLTSLLIKQMLLAGRMGDVPSARKHFALAEVECRDDPEILRILKYDFALALFKAGQFGDVNRITLPLIAEYYEVLGLELQDVLFVNPSVA